MYNLRPAVQADDAKTSRSVVGKVEQTAAGRETVCAKGKGVEKRVPAQGVAQSGVRAQQHRTYLQQAAPPGTVRPRTPHTQVAQRDARQATHARN